MNNFSNGIKTLIVYFIPTLEDTYPESLLTSLLYGEKVDTIIAAVIC